MIPIRRLLLIVPLLLVTVLNGCQNAFGYINAKWINEINLTMNPQNQKERKAPFETQAITEAAFIKTIAEAMNKSTKLSGKLDYGADLKMKLIYGDGYTEEYDLGLGEEKGHQGLLVSARNTSQGYTIPVKNADQLRELIYGTWNSTAEDGAVESVQSGKPAVTLSGPVTISRNELFPVTNRKESLSLRLVEGRYSEDWTTPGPLMGRNWSGEFQLVVNDEQGKTLSTFPLSEHFHDGLVFGDFFQIEFDDYNGDGHPDFTIGQYGSSNGSFYKLFTLGADHVIRELSINPAQELFLSTPGKYSVKLDKVDGQSFKTSFYDNSKGVQVEALYQWDGAEFQKVNP